MFSERMSKRVDIDIQQIITGAILLKYRIIGSFPSCYVAEFPKGTLFVQKTQSRYRHSDRWKKTANYCHKRLFFKMSRIRKVQFFNQYHKRLKPVPLQSHPSIATSKKSFAVFHLFKFRRDESTRVHDVKVVSFKCT